METRKCRKCGETKAIESFQIVRRGASEWRRHSCQPCESARKKDYYNTNIEEIRAKQNSEAKKSYRNLTKEQLAERAAWQRRYLEKHKRMVFDNYGRECVCCGESEPMFLSIDHVNNDGYLARKNQLHPTDTLGFYRWLVKNLFPADFQVLCMNCNFGKAKNNGVCPHQEGSTTIPKGSTAQAIGAGSASHPRCRG